MEKWRASNKCIICNIHFFMLHMLFIKSHSVSKSWDSASKFPIIFFLLFTFILSDDKSIFVEPW